MGRIIGILIVAAFTLSCVSAYAADGNEYWDNGKLRIGRKYDAEGELMHVAYFRKNGSIEQYIGYDRDGDKLEESYYGENGGLKETSDGWAAVRFTYIDGSMASESYYGSDGRLRERKEYDAAGSLVAKEYVGDGNIDPYEEYNPRIPLLGQETVSYFDSYGRSEGTTEASRGLGW
jgi:antitoxin component YwqK of YwqJK toxin-antitoxin module